MKRMAIGLGVGYLTLAITQSFMPLGTLLFGCVNTAIQVFLDAYIAITIYQRKSKLDRESLDLNCLFASFVFMAMGDIIYGLAVNVMNVGNLRGSFIESLYNTIYLVCLILDATYFVLSSHTQNKILDLTKWVITLIVGLLIVITFGGHIMSHPLPPYTTFVHIACLAAKAIIIGFGLLGGIFLRSSWRRLIASGFLIILSYSTLLEYLEIQNALEMGFPMEVFWTSGLVTILFGVSRIPSIKDDGEIWDPLSLSARLTIYSLILSATVIASWIAVHYFWTKHFPYLPKIGLGTSWAVLLLVSIGAYSYFMRSLLVSPMIELTEILRSKNETKAALRRDDLKFSKFSEFSKLSHEILLNFEALHQEKERNERLSQLASHMSHDIRSPLAALRMLTSQTDHLPEGTRRLITQIAMRINLIAENLLVENRPKSTLHDKTTETLCLIYDVVETIISEKRILLPNSRIQLDLNVSKEAYGCWVRLNSETAGRILSNLINNAIEAFECIPQLTNPRITVSIALNDRALRLSIQDNAGGIPEHIEKSIQMGAPATTKEKGSGLGLSQAAEILKNVEGQLAIFTQPGFGTVINVSLPTSDSPKWFSKMISINPKKPVLILDDDQSIHAVWRSRLESTVKIFNCFSISEAIDVLSKCPEGATILADLRIRGEERTGLDFLARVPKSYNRYLVTSHFGDETVHRQTEGIESSIVPKLLAPFVKIEWLS